MAYEIVNMSEQKLKIRVLLLIPIIINIISILLPWHLDFIYDTKPLKILPATGVKQCSMLGIRL